MEQNTMIAFMVWAIISVTVVAVGILFHILISYGVLFCKRRRKNDEREMVRIDYLGYSGDTMIFCVKYNDGSISRIECSIDSPEYSKMNSLQNSIKENNADDINRL